MPDEIIPLARPNITEEDIQKVTEVLRSGMLVQGENVTKLEDFIIENISTSYCSVVSSGTAGLHLALIALGIGPGDEVIVPAFSFIATANVVELVGAKCLFVDIHPKYFNIDEKKIESVITQHTKAIMPVHEFGLCSNMNEIMRIADKHHLYVVEDAACALGATFGNKYAGTIGHFGSFSLHPRKAVTAGEGGLLVTHSASLDYRIKSLRNHGIEMNSNPMEFIIAGLNYRMTDFQAALVLNQIKRLSRILEYRKIVANAYLEKIKNPNIILPDVPDYAEHTWQTFHVVAENNRRRDELMTYLKRNGVMSNYGAQCIPATKYYKEKYELNAEIDYPEAYKAYTSGLAIPMHEKLSEIQINTISNLINRF